MPANNPVVMRRSGDPANEAAGRHRDTSGGIEIGAAVAPPCARDDNAEPIGRVAVRRAHEAWPPAHQSIVEARLVDVPGQRAVIDAGLGEGGIRLPLQIAGGRMMVARGSAGSPPRFLQTNRQGRGERGQHYIPPKSRSIMATSHFREAYPLRPGNPRRSIARAIAARTKMSIWRDAPRAASARAPRRCFWSRT